GRVGMGLKIPGEVFMSNVLLATLGQAHAKQAALKAGLSNTTPCTTVNKVCASGMKAIMWAAQTIQLGMQDVVIAGGMENMTRIPYYVPRARFGYKYGNATLVDGLQRDGLSDAYSHKAMGISADKTAEKYNISREAQNEFAIQSYRRSAESTEKVIFLTEITPVEVPQRKGAPIKVTEDEESKKVNFEKIPFLRPAFSKNGTVTAANASTLNDGASALVLASEQFVETNGITPVAEVLGFADASHEPEWFTTAPVSAPPLALRRAKVDLNLVDLFEVNEAFAVVPMHFASELIVDQDKLNVLGGAVSLGHPLCASGARIVTTLINALHHRDQSLGCATICNGGGGASALVLRKIT